MEAIHVSEKKAALIADRCIGCGLCVSTCPTRCLSMVRKPLSQQADIPRDHVRSVIKVARARGKLGVSQLIRMQIKSKLDRLLARK
jgi:Fe-S-cluster-containing hydrogenase component 2